MRRARIARSSRILLSAVALSTSLLGLRASAQPTWLDERPAQSPVGRYNVAAAFDALRSRVVMFGGENNDNLNSGETWEWDGVTWTRRLPMRSPSPRYGQGMVYDSARGRVLLFGGRSTLTAVNLNDTWEWDGTNWSQIITATSPVPRSEFGMAYDSVRRVTVIFGGYETVNGGLQYGTDTWEFDGSNWQERFSSRTPSARCCTPLAFDPVRGKTLLFGGGYGNPPYILGETWEWDGTNWTLMTPIASPCARERHALVAVPAQGRTLLHGGWGRCETIGAAHPFSDTWAWDGTQWTEVSVAALPPPWQFGAAAFDTSHDVLVRFGGINTVGLPIPDTWTLGNPITLSSVVPAVGSEAGGDLIHVRGSRLEGVASPSVRIGGARATVVSRTFEEIRVRTPSGTGAADVQVGAATLPSAFTYAPASLAARLGNVNAWIGERENVLLVNGNTGNLRREISVGVHERLDAYVTTPSSRTDARFVLYAWIGEPGAASVTPLPRRLGAMVFPVPATGGSPQPRAIFNNLGYRRTLGAPTMTSSPAPSPVFSVNHGAPHAVDFALQGIIQDDGSAIPEGFSVTNAVIVHVK